MAVKVFPTCNLLATRTPSPFSSNDGRNMVNVSKKSSGTICKYWLNGNCTFGDECRYLHSINTDGMTFHLPKAFKKENSRPMRLIWWTAPPVYFAKINCDGAFTIHGNKASAGGVVRNWEGRFIFGFSSALSSCSVVEAELWAIKIGMEIAISRRFTNLIVESDSLIAIDLINLSLPSKHQALVSSITQMASMVNHVSWNHVFREINSVADSFAKHGLSLSQDQGVKVFQVPPYFSVPPLWTDKAGKVYCR